MITFQTELFSDIIEEAKPLLFAHWEEIAYDKTLVLNPNYAQYKVLQDAGCLHITTGRDDGVLIAYSCYLFAPNLHYMQAIFAETDIFYVVPEYRGRTVPVKLFKESERALTALGVHKVISKMKKVSDQGAIFERLDYEHFENIYGKTLNEII